VAAELAGDHEAAARSELALPDTGVCGGAGLFDDPDGASGGSCCAPAPQVLKIGLSTARGWLLQDGATWSSRILVPPRRGMGAVRRRRQHDRGHRRTRR